MAFETYGDATPDKRYILQSVGRTVVAATVWKLLGEGLLALDERVGDVIPEFATNGKDGRDRRAGAHPHRRLPVRPARLPEDARPGPAARGLRDVAPRLGAGQPPAVPPHRRGVGDRRAGRAPHRPQLRRLPPGRDRRAARPRVPAPRAGRPLRRGGGGARGHRPHERRPGGRPVGSVVPGRAPRCWRRASRATRSSPPRPIVALFFQALVHSGRLEGRRRRGGHPHPAVGAARRRQALRRQRRDRQPGPVLHGERRDRRHLDAAAPARRGTFGNGGAPCQLGFMDPETRHVVRLPHQRLSARRLRLHAASARTASSTSATSATTSSHDGSDAPRRPCRG